MKGGVPGKIIGIGRNYAAHAKELGNQVPSEMVLFFKPPSSFVCHPHDLVLPNGAEVHHEVELGVYIGKDGKNIPKSEAANHIGGYCVALDMTARNWQNDAKKSGLPWARAKGFDTSCAVGTFVSKDKIQGDVELWLKVNGVEKQRGTTADMIWNVDAVIEECSKVFTLKEGDLILTGTPSGVGGVAHGDVISCGIEGICQFEWRCVNEKHK